MATEHTLQVSEHPTILRGPSFPPMEKCTNCCFPGRYHCPFCPPECFKPSRRFKLMVHLEYHKKYACSVDGYTIYKCAFDCRKKPHYHCMYCKGTLLRRRDFVNHVPLCLEAPKNKNSSQSELTALLISDNTDSDDTYDLEESHEGSSSRHFLNPVVSQSNRDTAPGLSRRGSPNTSRCDQMVQTHIEKPQDCDEFYFMNLVKIFKRLTPQKKTDVRLRIERILFEAEFQ
ncbi:uncharacterized protein LOC112160847 [Oryzias melastigma]|uniref:uncharacterized protein LOC112160847 n=1 Tax=Oryzias melastigma TaxID=30732 RepID=UPI000CF7E8FE|nr:uncharacterized protein LOC112160847 [Oryzias melastigma]